jgi:hypothetical protein
VKLALSNPSPFCGEGGAKRRVGAAKANAKTLRLRKHPHPAHRSLRSRWATLPTSGRDEDPAMRLAFGSSLRAPAKQSMLVLQGRKLDRFVASAPRDDVAHTSHDLSISHCLHPHLHILAASFRARFTTHEAHLKFRGRRECRALEAPAASRAKIEKHTSIVTTVTPDSPGIPRAMVLTVSSVISSVIGLVCHRHQQNEIPLT